MRNRIPSASYDAASAGYSNGARGVGANGAAARESVDSPEMTSVGGDIGELVDNISTLAELQFKLFHLDVQTALRRAIGPLGMAIFGGVLMFACVPVLLMGVAWMLVEQAQWSTGAALLATAAVGALLGAALAGLGAYLLRQMGSALDRSRVEFFENIRWIKAAFNRRTIREKRIL